MVIESVFWGMLSCFDGTSPQGHLLGNSKPYSSPDWFRLVREILPELGHELASSVRGSIRVEAIMSNLSAQEGISHLFGICASWGNSLWPVIESVHN